MVRLADLLAAGESHAAIAEELGRSYEAIRLRARRVLSPVDGWKPGWGKRPMGVARYWTRERVLAGLRAFAAANPGPVPCACREYAQMKKGHMEWPTAGMVLLQFGTMPDAWAEAGVSRARYHRSWVEWTQDDDDYLLERAGSMTLKIIAKKLGRTWPACKRRLYDLGAGRARDVSGYMSAMQVAQEYRCPLSRVTSLIASGALPARKVLGGHYWRIDPADCEAIAGTLRAPKRRSYQGTPPDMGDYDRRYGYRRMIVNGRMERVPVGRAS
jgi:hypothetical protein